MRKTLGWLFLLSGLWCLMSPQAALGLKELKWMVRYAFPAEALLGCVLLSAAFAILNISRPARTDEGDRS